MDSSIFILVALVLGVIVGAVFSWLWLRTRLTTDGAAKLATLHERLAGREQEFHKLEATLAKDKSELERMRGENTQLQAELQGERRAAQERLASFNKASDDLTEKFKALSRDALKDNNRSFLDLAQTALARFQETAKGDLESRQKAIDQLVQPLKAALETVDGKIGLLEKERAGAYSELREQIRGLATSQLQLQAETGNLVKALRAARRREMFCIGVLGKEGGPASELTDVSIIVPSNETSRIQEVQLLVLHVLSHLIEQQIVADDLDTIQITEEWSIKHFQVQGLAKNVNKRKIKHESTKCD